MTGNRSAPNRPVIIVLSALFLLALGGVWWSIDGILHLVEREFGAPANSFTHPQRLLYTFRLFSVESKLTRPLNPSGNVQTFEVSTGEPVTSIANRLQNESLIQSAEAFRWYLIYTGIDTNIQAGEHELSPALSAVQIAHALQVIPEGMASLTIFPGWRAEEIAAALPLSGLDITPEVFLEAVMRPSSAIMPDNAPPLTSLEGFLFPGTYYPERDASVEDILGSLIQKFDENITVEIREAYTKQGLDLVQAVTLASIIQRETTIPGEQPIIASVLLNRLETNMKLETDPTVQYALGYNTARDTWWVTPLTLNDLSIDSPYNTYVIDGLPPGPICSPRLDALKAVANPAETPYLYYRARCDDSRQHNFAVTYQEHLQNACP